LNTLTSEGKKQFSFNQDISCNDLNQVNKLMKINLNSSKNSLKNKHKSMYQDNEFSFREHNIQNHDQEKECDLINLEYDENCLLKKKFEKLKKSKVSKHTNAI